MKNTQKNNEEEFFSKVAVSYVDRSIYFFDEVEPASVAEAFKIIQILETQSKKPIRLVINSNGGDVYSGLALFDRIKISPCKIITVGTGFVASMGLIIFLAGEERVITPNTVLLNHQNSMSMSGRTDDVKIEAREMARLETLTINIISSVTGQPIKKIKEEIKAGDKYIPPAQALTEGYAHFMLEHRKPIVKVKEK